MITAVIIPPDFKHPVLRVELIPRDYRTYQSIVHQSRLGSNLKTRTLELHNPSMTLYSDGAIKTPLNPRATFMLWAHNSELSGKGVIVGHALLIGNHGADVVSVPDDIVEQIFHTTQY